MPETAEQYRQRMFSHIGGNEPLKLMAAAPGKLARLLKGVTAAKARKRPSPGKWSVVEIVSHIADTELVGGYRIRAILGAPGSRIMGFDQDVWATTLHYEKRNLHRAFDQYRALREANLVLLRTLTPEQWKRHGMHEERGAESVETIVRMFAGHDLNHCQQIERILAAPSGRRAAKNPPSAVK